ncbi:MULTISPECIES: hypothetical protein [Prochlorococcus]|uniref:hypothetical protein n=1 Tax=Prochlorococcus TaxID=1218 RepID=UPI000533B34A|nr:MULTISPECIES: hypothetical protein [Prochlorococcus]KGG12257.1 hypothetical protein EV05_1467 [Prochlorococcus sp. MIT 0601]
MTIDGLAELEKQAFNKGFLLRIQVRRPINFWAFKLSVARFLTTEKVQILGEMKGWAYNGVNGLQLDTMIVRKNAPKGIGHLIWAATMAWALEETVCRKARLLAIYDENFQHHKLIRYFQRRGFQIVRSVGSAPFDLPLRLIWGGSGSLMTADCSEVYKYSRKLWELN